MIERGRMYSGYVRSLGKGGFHDMYYIDTDPTGEKPPVLCVHGLSRNHTDFLWLIEALQHKYRFIAPDIVGRGRSDWLPEPAFYTYEQYMQDITVLIARLNVEAVQWIGTSMGGLIGMILAAQPKTPITTLILNDIGPFIEKEALQMIGHYVCKTQEFISLSEVISYLKSIYCNGPLENNKEYWEEKAKNSTYQSKGYYYLAYDTNIVQSLKNPDHVQEVNLWPVWEQISCPTYVIRGKCSKVLTRACLDKMLQSLPSLRKFIELPDVGHPAALVTSEEITAIDAWLSKD